MDANILYRKRKALGWSQEKLAKQLDVHRATIINWEQGHVEIPKAVQIALEKIFDDQAAA